MAAPDVEVAHPWMLLLALVPLVLAAWQLRRPRRPSLRVPAAIAYDGLPTTLRQRLRGLPLALRVLALVALAVALARPRGGELIETVTTEGIDIVVALDTSGSMLALDMTTSAGAEQDRLAAAKEVIADFVQRRTSDRIGLLTFDEASVPRCPPTLDYDVLLGFLDQVQMDLESRGTAIGAGLASAVSRLKDSKAASRIVILVTDGRNNAGRIEPVDAAKIAQLMGIKVYTVGIGTRGQARVPVGRDMFGRTQYQMIQADVDEPTLLKIADMTSGRYYRATDGEQLERIFADIDQLEKSEIDVRRHVRYREHFPPILRLAAGFVAVAALAGTYFRSFP
jgi:Ca-activated chloride channel family protein